MTTAQFTTRVPCTSGAPTTITGSSEADPSTIVSIAASTPSSNVCCISRSSMEYPHSDSSGNTASATDSSWHRRACSSTISALRAGSAMATGTVQAATRAKPWAYDDQKSTPQLYCGTRSSVGTRTTAGRTSVTAATLPTAARATTTCGPRTPANVGATSAPSSAAVTMAV